MWRIETVQDLLSATDGARVPEENEKVLEEFVQRFCPETKADDAHRKIPSASDSDFRLKTVLNLLPLFLPRISLRSH